MCSASIALASSCFVASFTLITNSLSFLPPVLFFPFATGLVFNACALIAIHVAVLLVWLSLRFVNVFCRIFSRSFLVSFMYVATLSRFC